MAQSNPYVISFDNVKGGVTKTTSSVNFAIGLARTGRSVLLIDADPQSNATYTVLGIISEAQKNTLYEVIIDGKPLDAIIRETKVPCLSMAPGTLALTSADLLLASRTGREWILRRAIEGMQAYHFDYIVIDTPPNLNVVSVNILAACSGFILPIALDIFAFLGIKLLENTLAELRENLRIPIPLIGVVATLHDNTIESRERLQQVKDYFGDLVFQTVIPTNVKVKEANDQQVLYDYAPKSTGSIAYTRFVEEVIARVER